MPSDPRSSAGRQRESGPPVAFTPGFSGVLIQLSVERIKPRMADDESD